MTIEGRGVQRIDGCRDDAWTMDNKKKRKKRKRERRRGREVVEEEERTAREAIWRSQGKFIYTEAYISDTERNAMPMDYLVVTGGLD